jgi:hypothetical protein
MITAMRDDRGTVTAEFAVVLPAVVLVLACALGALQLGAQQLRLQAAVGGAARLLGRGDGGANELVAAVDPDARVEVRRVDSMVCVQARAPARLPIALGVTLAASSCALDDAQP